MARETYGAAGLYLPVAGTNEVFSTATEVENLKKLSRQIDEQKSKIDELYSRTYKSNTSTGESTASIGSAASGWAVQSWAFDCRGFAASVRIDIKRTGNNINGNASGNLTNTLVLTLQSRFRPVSSTPLQSSASGQIISGHVASDGKIYLDATVPNNPISKNEVISFSGVFIMLSPGLS